MSSFDVEILSPSGPLFHGPCRAVRLPAYKGEMEVLPSHAPYGTLLVPGDIALTLASGEMKTVPILGQGLADIAQERVRIFADS